jgi:hypothetical protein
MTFGDVPEDKGARVNIFILLDLRVRTDPSPSSHHDTIAREDTTLISPYRKRVKLIVVSEAEFEERYTLEARNTMLRR